MKETEVRHESFGTISFSKVQSSHNQNLFGSSIPHRHFIMLEIRQAILKRDLHRDWIFGDRVLLRVDMSLTQFADVITSLNTSEVPCTICFFNGKSIESKPIENKRMQIDREFAEFADEIASEENEYYKKIETILRKPNIGKHDRVEIMKQLDLSKMQIASNMPFVKKRFTEEMDNTVLEAKNEFSAFVDDKIRMAGLKGLKKESFMLDFDDKETTK